MGGRLILENSQLMSRPHLQKPLPLPALEKNTDTYRTIELPSEDMYKVKGSKHFAFAYPVYSIDEIKEKLDFLRKEHFSARHHCYAYRLGLDKKVFRANDDGEPSNTAGKPILGQIQSYDLTNILIVVIRYFGGTKLGVGGLIDAYKTASKMAIEQANIIEKQVKNHYKIDFKYEHMSHVMKYLKDHNLPQENQQFDLNCSLETWVRLADSSQFEIGICTINGILTEDEIGIELLGTH